jgi:hypothetical protein
MPRYYFHVDGQRPHVDVSGEELPDDERAWVCALRTLRDVEDGLAPGDEWSLKVYRGKTHIFTVTVTSFHLAGKVHGK